MTILAVDDSLINLKLLSVILEKEKLDFISCSDSFEVIDLVHEKKPDLILMDIMMPGTNGIDILKYLKSMDETKNIPVLMVTARSRGEDVMMSLENGAFDYLKKPLDEIEVVARVRSALRYKDYQDKLLQMASRDSLTEVYNHALLIDLLEKELYNQQRKGNPVSFLMLDIDHFKAVNDNYGHPIGDQVLKDLCQILGQVLRKGDPIGRYGGEEFGIILSGVYLDLALQLSERIRQSVESNQFPLSEPTLPMTVSIGVAISLPEAPLTAKELIKRADLALYEAKSEGRNQVIHAK